MKIEQIEQLWQKDCQIDITDLSGEAAKIPQLHSKYYQIYSRERLLLKSYQADYKKLKLDKYCFLINPTEQQVKQHGWEVPAQGKLLKTEVAIYLEGDKDLIAAELKIALQQEKTDYVKSILDSIHNRGYLIKNIIEDRRFINGG